MFERRYTELRQEGRRLSGVAIRYGEIGQSPFGPERFEAGAFQPLGDVILNVQHERGRPLARTGAGLILDDDETALQVRADLPGTTEADNTLALVKAGVLKGLSIEFKALQERSESDLRIVEKAVLKAVGVVDSGAYPGSNVEARRRGGGWFRGLIPYRKRLDCQCHKGSCNRVQFDAGTFDESIDGDGEILAIAGDYRRGLSSRSKGSLKLTSTAEGVQVDLLDAADTQAAADLEAMSKVMPIYARPVFDADTGVFVERGDTAFYSKARLKAILIGPTDRDGGWTPGEFGGKKRTKKRFKVWL